MLYYCALLLIDFTKHTSTDIASFSLPYWRLKPYVRPVPLNEPKKRKVESLEQNKRRKLEKAKRVKRFHQKVLNEVLILIKYSVYSIA